MSYRIDENYSFLNNYNYTNKSRGISALDFLSAPYRKILGGRDVSVCALMVDPLTSTISKVAIVAASVFAAYLYMPLIAIPAISLALKFVVFTFLGEKENIISGVVANRQSLDAFDRKYNIGNLDAALGVLGANWGLYQREDVRSRLNEIVSTMIKNTATPFEKISPWIPYVTISTDVVQRLNYEIKQVDGWDRVQCWIPLLGLEKSIEVIGFYINDRLERENRENNWRIKSKDIREFVAQSISDKSIDSIGSCYTKLFSGALRVKEGEDPAFSAFKMVLADDLITDLTKRKMSGNLDSLQKEMVLLLSDAQRFSVTWNPDFKDPLKVKEMRALVLKRIREQAVLQLSKNPPTWKTFRAYLIDKSIDLVWANERQWLVGLIEMFDRMSAIINRVDETSSISALDNLLIIAPPDISEITTEDPVARLVLARLKTSFLDLSKEVLERQVSLRLALLNGRASSF